MSDSLHRRANTPAGLGRPAVIRSRTTGRWLIVTPWGTREALHQNVDRRDTHHEAIAAANAAALQHAANAEPQKAARVSAVVNVLRQEISTAVGGTGLIAADRAACSDQLAAVAARCVEAALRTPPLPRATPRRRTS